MIFLYFFQFYVIFALLDPDTVTQINADPDPKPCFDPSSKKGHNFAFRFGNCYFMSHIDTDYNKQGRLNQVVSKKKSLVALIFPRI